MATQSHRLTEQASGVYIIAATPFDDQGEVDLYSIDSLTDFYLEKGVTGFTILGIVSAVQMRVNLAAAPLFVCLGAYGLTALGSRSRAGLLVGQCGQRRGRFPGNPPSA